MACTQRKAESVCVDDTALPSLDKLTVGYMRQMLPRTLKHSNEFELKEYVSNNIKEYLASPA